MGARTFDAIKIYLAKREEGEKRREASLALSRRIRGLVASRSRRRMDRERKK